MSGATSGSAAPHALVPWPVDPPPGLVAGVFDGAGDRPGDLTAVEFYVVPYDQPGGLDLIADLPALRAVQLLTAGYEKALDVVPPGVALHNGAGLHDSSTSELALALILAAQRDLPRWAVDQREHRWQPQLTRSLDGCRVLIVGYGNIGQAIEARLAPFEVSITAVASRARPEQGVHGIDELRVLLPAADVVVLVLPDTAATRGLIGAAELALLPDDALLVNVGRGTAVDTAALVAQQGRIRAALDVVDPEPLPADHPLWDLPGVFITPHIGGGTSAFWPRARRFVDEQLQRWAAGQPLANHVTTG
jgi:phosphoglycerate dehydrogenase-like enzyme